MHIIKHNVKHQNDLSKDHALVVKFFKYLGAQQWTRIKDTKHKYEFKSDKGHHIVFDLDEKQYDDWSCQMTAKISKDKCKIFYIVPISCHWEFDEFIEWAKLKKAFKS